VYNCVIAFEYGILLLPKKKRNKKGKEKKDIFELFIFLANILTQATCEM
jgi:hypothetical protein